MQPQHLAIYALRNRHGLGVGVIWDWFRTQLPADLRITVLDAMSPARPPADTTHVLLMGQRTLQTFTAHDASIFKARGSFQCIYGHPATATFDLQDADDFRNMGHDNVYEETNDNAESSGKDRAATSKKNWRFWIAQDAQKLLTKPVVIEQPKFFTQPDIDLYTARLADITDRTLFIDIEVNMQSGKLDCIGLAVDDSPVLVFPIYDYKGNLFYPRAKVLRFLAALSRALRRNLTVAHNAMFDLVYLPSECRLPVGPRIYDTMIAHQRMFAEVEKSLGHCISMWTWQPWHKDEGGSPHSYEQQVRFWEYNAKDVWCTRMVYRAQQAWLQEHPEYLPSVNQACDSIYPYIIMTLTGCRIDQIGLINKKQELRLRTGQLTRILKLLIGDQKLNPNSVDQLRRFYFDKLCYKPTARTESGKPALGEKQIYQLACKYDNPSLQVLLQYRAAEKELGMASFQDYCFPWQRKD